MSEPDCPFGYPLDQCMEAIAAHGRTIEEFAEFMYGQTQTLCPEHGPVVYARDLHRFIGWKPLTDTPGSWGIETQETQ